MSNGFNSIQSVSALLVGLAVAYGGYLYRDSFDAPRINIEHVRVDVPRESLSISDTAHQALRIDGNVMGYIDERVRWSVNSTIEANDYSYGQIGDVNELLPHVQARFVELVADYERIRRMLVGAQGEVETLDGQQRRRTYLRGNQALARHFAAIRNYYIGEWNTDINLEFRTNPVDMLTRMIADNDGDLNQAEETVNTIGLVLPEIQRLYAAGEADPRPSNDDEVPNVTFTAIVSNTGRTATLIRNSATFEMEGRSVHLIRYDSAADRRVRSYVYEEVGAGDVATLVYALDTASNSHNDAVEIYESLASDGAERISGTLTIQDIGGDRHDFTYEQ